MLEWRNHTRGVELQVIGDISKRYILDWPAITDVKPDACGWIRGKPLNMALRLSHSCYPKTKLGYSAFERSRQGTGIDYWMGQSDDAPFQRQAMLEISGILKARGNVARAIKRRVNEKLQQTERSSEPLPTYVIVVEFGSPMA